MQRPVRRLSLEANQSLILRYLVSQDEKRVRYRLIESLIEAIESIKNNPITCLNDVRKYLASVEASSMDMRFYFKDMVLSRKSIGRSKQHDELQNDAEVDNYSISRLSAKIFE